MCAHLLHLYHCQDTWKLHEPREELRLVEEDNVPVKDRRLQAHVLHKGEHSYAGDLRNFMALRSFPWVRFGH